MTNWTFTLSISQVERNSNTQAIYDFYFANPNKATFATQKSL